MWNVAFAEVDKAHEAKFQWVTGEAVNYKHWYSGEPNNSGNVEYFALIYPNGYWYDMNFDVARVGVYERKTAPPRDSTIEWLRWEKNLGGTGNWYGVNTDEMYWTNHKKAAEKLGAHLATISSVEENTLVLSITKKHGNVWIGLAHPTGPPLEPPEPTGGGYNRMNITGRVLGVPPPIDRTSPTKSEPTQAQGNYTRQSLRIRTGLN